MPPGNRLAPVTQNAFGSPPTLAEIQLAARTAQRPSPMTLGQRAQELNYGLGRGFTNILQGNLDLAQALYQDPRAVGMGFVDAATQLVQDPAGVVGNSLRSMWNRAKSSPAGLGEVVGENIDPRNWLKPRKALRKDIFVGSKSRTWNSNAAAAAAHMESKGATPEQIWESTGTWRGPDGNWRQEISDENIRFRDDFAKRGLTEENKFQYPPAKPLPEALSAPELTTAYPEVQSLSVNARKLPDWVPESSSSGGELATMSNRPVGIFAYNKTEAGALDTAAHELQHVVQKLEGFAPGGIPNQFYRQVEQSFKDSDPQKWAALSAKERTSIVEAEAFRRYRNLMGEAEARATAVRRNLPWLERRQRFPGLDYDVPIGELTR